MDNNIHAMHGAQKPLAVIVMGGIVTSTLLTLLVLPVLYEALAGVQTLVTFNGSTFDLPMIRKRLYSDLKRDFEHCDLLYICRRRGLRGGLKKVEELLGIGWHGQVHHFGPSRLRPSSTAAGSPQRS